MTAEWSGRGGQLALLLQTALVERSACREMFLTGKPPNVCHIIMTALRKDGININDADMVEDGRRIGGRDLAQ
jgi:hypothetical protein